jgi:2-polyprenyl-3-methyl-5-hydroxy-6-metoxy-1,4-benzoquinol methylase
MGLTERVVEVPWVLAHLGQPQRILDVGACGSAYLPQLVATGAKVWALDTRPLDAVVHGVEQVVSNAASAKLDGELPFWVPDERFDLIVCVSVIDHVGLAAYGNQADAGALGHFARNLHDWLCPGGRLLLTTPFGRDHVTTHPGGAQRVFGAAALERLFPISHWKQHDCAFWKLAEDGEYHQASIAQVLNAEYAGHRAGACLAWELEKRAVVVQELPCEF